MVDTGIQEVKTYQFILLPGTEAASNISQSKYEYEIRFRVLPKSFGRYSLNGQIFNVVEYNQVAQKVVFQFIQIGWKFRDLHIIFQIPTQRL